jgi:hypothetical protein
VRLTTLKAGIAAVLIGLVCASVNAQDPAEAPGLSDDQGSPLTRADCLKIMTLLVGYRASQVASTIPVAAIIATAPRLRGTLVDNETERFPGYTFTVRYAAAARTMFTASLVPDATCKTAWFAGEDDGTIYEGTPRLCSP